MKRACAICGTPATPDPRLHGLCVRCHYEEDATSDDPFCHDCDERVAVDDAVYCGNSLVHADCAIEESE